jgi:RHS repeat-associated protein
VTNAGGNYFCYDLNGNLTRRNATSAACANGDALLYDAENRLTSITVGGTTTTFVYDGDGNRVKKTVNGVSTFYVGNHYEVTNGVATKYYYFGKQRVALRSAAGVVYLHSDHLGSTSVTTNASGQCTSAQWYYAYGNLRTPAPTTPCSGTPATDFAFTGQRRDASAGLLFYNARYYDPTNGRFVSADTMVPQAGSSQALNRYSYVGNNPLKYTDPSGHCWGVASFVQGLPSYDVTCSNMDMALTIVGHPNASLQDKAFAGLYFSGEVGLHLVVAGGTAVIAWQAIVPTLTAGGTGAAIAEGACGDGDCTNEARAASHGVQMASEQIFPAISKLSPTEIARFSQSAPNAGTTVLGRVGNAGKGISDYRSIANSLNANALNVPNGLWNVLPRAQQWAVNKAFLDLAIRRGDTFRLSYSYSNQMEFTRRLLAKGVAWDDLPALSRELLYLESQGYHLSRELINGQWVESMIR